MIVRRLALPALLLAMAGQAEAQNMFGLAARPAMPTTSPSTWIVAEDYPAAARQEKRQGTGSYRLSIGVDGAITDCRIVRSSGHADLDEATCKAVMQRAAFSPAWDYQGVPTPGLYANRARWVLPN